MKSEFVFIAESGSLEQQSLLLCESIREFGGKYSTFPIKILQPRPDRRISDDARIRLESMDAEIIELAIVSPCPEYGSSYRVFACAEYERLSQADVLIFLDSDTLLLAEPDLELENRDTALRPIDIKGMCTAGPEDSFDSYWRDLCRTCGVDYESLPEITGTVDRAQVKASYNGGLTVVKRASGLFGKTAEFFQKSMDEKLVPWPYREEPFPAGHGMVSVEGGKLWGSAQAALSLAITALGLSVRILPPSQNFPLHSYGDLAADIASGDFPRPTLIHYHHLFSGHPRDNPILSGKPGFPEGSARWLRSRKNRDKHLILVLGMHRSGTSVLTKSLQAFGVDLGANFNPETPDNPTGFWEDRDFQAFNEKILNHLHRSWDDLQLVESDVASPDLNKYLPEALAILDAFMHEKSLAGLKDPRFSLLLPFWKKVFTEAGLQVSFIVGFRHPLSVAASLAHRDGFSNIKSLWIWILHHIHIAAGTAGLPTIVIDYDEMLDQPRSQLARLSRFLKLSPTSDALESFCSEFLRPDLRHARNSVADLRDNADIDSIVVEIYELFAAQSADSFRPDFTHLKNTISRWEQSLRPFKGLLHLSSVLGQEQSILKAQAALRNQEFHSQLKTLEAVQKTGIDNNAKLSLENIGLVHKNTQLDQQAAVLHGKIAELEQQAAGLHRQTSDLHQKIQRMKASVSWRITAPWRYLERKLKALSSSP